MNLNPIKPNMTELEVNGHTILFSYKTPVASFDFNQTLNRVTYFRTSKRWSNTTTRHINQWLGGCKAEIMPQEFFDRLVA